MKSPFLLFLVATSLPAAEPIELKLWPDGAPGQMQPHSKATDDFIRTKAGKSTITDITDPTITVYRPEKPNGTSVIVAPGGGYVFLSAVHEGSQVCEWLNTIGVTGILLKYRTPTRDEAAPHEKPVQDAAKAIALVREHAKEWNLDPKRVGLLGFSAGGNLLAHIACDRDWSKYPANYEQMVAGMPNFGIMIYGGGFVDFKEPTKLKEGFSVPADAPPMFLACAHDDGQNPIAATVLYLEYKKQNIPCELHLFTKGGHGFGMRKAGNPINDWPLRCAEWMGGMDLLPTLEKLNAAIAKCEDGIAELKRQGPLLFMTPIDNDSQMRLEKEIGELAQKIQAAHSLGNEAEVQQLQKKSKEFRNALNEYYKDQDETDAMRRKHVLELDKLSKEKARLEALRVTLLHADHALDAK